MNFVKKWITETQENWLESLLRIQSTKTLQLNHKRFCLKTRLTTFWSRIMNVNQKKTTKKLVRERPCVQLILVIVCFLTLEIDYFYSFFSDTFWILFLLFSTMVVEYVTDKILEAEACIDFHPLPTINFQLCSVLLWSLRYMYNWTSLWSLYGDERILEWRLCTKIFSFLKQILIFFSLLAESTFDLLLLTEIN